MTISVLLVDDHPVVRSGLRAVLEGKEITIVGEAATGEEALTLAGVLTPDVVLCDLRLGDGIDGIETTTALRQLPHPPAVLMLTTFDRDSEVLGAVAAGASGYLLKDVAPEVIIEGIVRAAAGHTVLSPELTSRVISGMRSPQAKLTEREVEVVRLLDTGASNAEIAAALFVTQATVKTHLSHIFAKLGAESRARAVHIARASGLI